MRTKLQVAGLTLVIVTAMLANAGTAFAAPATASLGLDVIMHGLAQDSGVTLAAPVAIPDTTVTVTDSRPFKPGEYLELYDPTPPPVGGNWEVMRVAAAAGDGPGGITDTVSVLRGQNGTTARSYVSGTSLYADFTRIAVNVAGVAPVDSGAQLSALLDTGTFDPTGALLVESINSSVTQFKVSDARLIPYPGQIKIDSEAMTVIGESFGEASPSGAYLAEDVTFSSKTTINIDDYTKLQVGWRAQVAADSAPTEQMLIVGLSGDGPGGALQDTMTVVRGATIGNLLNGTPIYSGPDKVSVMSRTSGNVAHSAAAAISDNFRIARVNNQALVGAGSNITIDSEQMQVRSLPSKHFHSSGATLTGGVTASGTLFRISDAHALSVGDIVRVDAEEMAVQRSTPGCTIGAGAVTMSAIDAVQTVIDINDRNLVSSDCAISIGAEEMLVTSVTGDGPNPPGTLADQITVVRGFNDTTAAAHAAGAIAAALPAARVTRALYATTGAAHSNGASIDELTTETNTMRVSRPNPPASHASGASIIDIDGVGAYSASVSSPTPATTATIASFVGPSGAQTTLDVNNPGALQPGWVILVDSEKMRVLSVGASTITVDRAVNGTALGTHNVSAPISGPVMLEYKYGSNGAFLGSSGRVVDCSASPPTLQAEGVTVGCATQGLGLGATGSGTLAYIEVWGSQLLPFTPTQTVNIAPSLVDVSGNSVPASGNPTQKLKVLKCDDVNGNGVFNLADTTLTLRAYFGIDPVNLATMDINLDGNLTIGSDVTLAKRVLFYALPGGSLRCLPNMP